MLHSYPKNKNKRSNVQPCDQISYKMLFRNEEGAIDLASIMVGIIVIGLVGGVIAATVFAVIPWSQDKAAKQQLDSIVSAQSAYKGLSSGVPPATPEGHPENSYADSALLASAGLLTENDNYCTISTDGGSGYQAVALSGSGEYWTVTDKKTQPESIASIDIPVDCGFPYVDRTPKLTKLSYNCPTTKTIPLPISDGEGTATWSDGEVVKYSGSEKMTKTLTAGVDYQLTFEGTYTRFSHDYSSKATMDCLRSLDHWGSETGVTDASGAFRHAVNLTDVPKQIPSTIVNMQSMFYEASSINDPDISHWDISNVAQTGLMFYFASAFNQPLEKWNVSNVKDMSMMFESAPAFNQPLEKWDVSNVTNMTRVFRNAHNFNQPLEKWNVSNVTNMNQMFSVAQQFDQPLNGWDVSNVADMDSLFSYAYNFDQPLDKWDVSNATTMYGMFSHAFSFDHSLNEWDVSNVTNMSNMFSDARLYNQPLDEWDTSSVTNVSSMFNFASLFDQPLNDWDVSKVTNMSLMFNNAYAFNQPLNDWNVSKVRDLHRIFDGSSNIFDQDLSGWDTASLTDGGSFARKAFPAEKLPKGTSVSKFN